MTTAERHASEQDTLALRLKTTDLRTCGSCGCLCRPDESCPSCRVTLLQQTGAVA